MDKSETITALATALAKAQAAIRPALKDSENPHFRSRYADLSSVWDACRKPLTENGLSIVQMPVDSENGRVALTTMLLHTSGEYISSTVSTALTKNDAQGIGSALTYLRRYALSAVVGVVADEDDDGNAASRTGATAGAKRTTEPTHQPRTNNANGAGGASDKQLGMIRGKAKAWGWNEDDVIAFAAERGIRVVEIGELNGRQASALIEAMLKAEHEAA